MINRISMNLQSFKANVTIAKNLSKKLTTEQMMGVNAFCEDKIDDINQVDVKISKAFCKDEIKLTTFGNNGKFKHSDNVFLYKTCKGIEKVPLILGGGETEVIEGFVDCSGLEVQKNMSEVYDKHVEKIGEQIKLDKYSK